MPGLTPREYRRYTKKAVAVTNKGLAEYSSAQECLENSLVGGCYFQMLWCTRGRKQFLRPTAKELSRGVKEHILLDSYNTIVEQALLAAHCRPVLVSVCADGVFLVVSVPPTVRPDSVVILIKHALSVWLGFLRLRDKPLSIWDRKYWIDASATVQSDDDMGVEALRQQRGAFIAAQTPRV